MTTGRLLTVVGDGTYLTIGEAMERLKDAGCPASDTTVRSYVEKRWLRAWWTGGGHHRIEASSIDELVPVLKMRPGPARRAAEVDLVRRNEPGDDSTPPA